MFRAIVVGLTVLHLGPGLAFVLLAFGCDSEFLNLAPRCGQGVASTFAILTLCAWAIMGLGLLAWRMVRRAAASGRARVGPRVAALLSLLVLGLAVGAAGHGLTSSQLWFLAVPVAMTVGWLFLANPLACQPGVASDAGP